MVSLWWEHSVRGVNPCLHHDHNWGLSQISVCDFNLRKSSPPILGWTSMTRLVSLGGHVPLDVGFQSRDKKNEDVTWMCSVVGLWELKPWPQPWSPVSLWDWMDGVQGLDPTLDLLGVCVGGHLLFMLTLQTTLCYSPVTLSSDLLSPSKPCSGWL